MNGWKNYATWAAVSWGYDEIDEYSVGYIMRDRSLSEHNKINKIAELLQQQFEESADNSGYKASGTLFSDLFEHVAFQIDWNGIAEHIYSDNEHMSVEEDTEE